jgi:hypothetical protein
MINLTREEAQPEQMTSSSIAQARAVAGLLRERNARTWDDIDREAVFAIDALVSFASTLLNHRLNSVRAKPEPMIDGYPLHSGLPKPEPEPVAWTVGGLITDFSRDFSAYKTKTYTQPLYTAPPQREWQGLTDEEIMSLLPGAVRLPPGWADTVRAITAKLKEKNA